MHSVGDGATWKKYYRETTEERKERRRLNEENIDKRVDIAVEKKSTETVATVVAAAKQVALDISTTLVPAIFNWTRKNPKKDAADYPLADFLAGSSSTSVALAPAATPAPAPAPAPDVLGGASSLAELDALTVSVTLAPFNINV